MTNPSLASRFRSLLPLLLGLITFLVFYPTTRNGFINYDDPDYVLANPWIQQGFSWESLRWAFRAAHSSNWHPVTWLSHMVDWRIFGPNAAGHHFTSVLFHSANAMLVFWVLHKMTRSVWRSLLVAALFALHPMHVESVAWIAERKDLLSAFFGLLSMGFYTKYAQRRQLEKAGWHSSEVLGPYVLSLVFFAAGLMSKPMLVTWPFVLLLLDVWPLQRLSSTQVGADRKAMSVIGLVLEKLPFLALTTISITITIWAQKLGGSIQSAEQLPFVWRIQNAIVSYAVYLKKAIWPTDLAVFHPFLGPPSTTTLLVALVSFLLISAVAIWKRRSRPYLFSGWFLFVGTLVPVIGIIQVGDQAFANRYTYIPYIGLFIALAWALGEGVQRKTTMKMPVVIISGLATLGCGVLTWQQIPVWRSTATLFEQALRVTEKNFLAATVVASERMAEGKNEAARPLLKQAIQWKPHYAEAHLAMGNIHLGAGETGSALQAYREALKFKPRHPEAHIGYGTALLQAQRYADAEKAFSKSIEINPISPRGYLNLGISLHHQRKFGQAIRAFETALKMVPSYTAAYMNMAQSFIALDDKAKAEAAFKTALQWDPNNARLNFEYAAFQELARRPQEALKHYREAIRLEPASPDALNNVAWLLATTDDPGIRDPKAAVVAGEKAAALTQGKVPVILGTLAAAYAEAGQFEKAIEFADKARKLAETLNMPQVAESNARLLRLYRNQRTARDLNK